jgi:hypothetical protein
LKRAGDLGIQHQARAARFSDPVCVAPVHPASPMNAPAQLLDPPSPADAYRLVREQIQHEDNLIAQRLSWLIASQAFMFSAYAITLNMPERTHASRFSSQQQLLALLIPIVAGCIGVLVMVAMAAGVLAMADLRRAYRRMAPHTGPCSVPIQGSSRTRLLGLVTPLLLPPLFTGVWAFLLMRATQ